MVTFRSLNKKHKKSRNIEFWIGVIGGSIVVILLLVLLIKILIPVIF